MWAVKSGKVEITHGDSEVGQIKLEKWVSERLVVHARGQGQQRNIMRGKLEQGDNFFSLLKTVLVVFLLHCTQCFVAGEKGKMRGRKRKGVKRKERW